MKDKHIGAIDVVTSIRQIDPKVECGSDTWLAYATCLAGLVVGLNEKRIARFMKIPLEAVERFGANLRKNKIWDRGKIRGDWFNPQTGGAELALAVNVALGYMERADKGRAA